MPGFKKKAGLLRGVNQRGAFDTIKALTMSFLHK